MPTAFGTSSSATACAAENRKARMPCASDCSSAGVPRTTGSRSSAPAVREQAQRFAQDRDPAVRAADGNGERPRGAHHDALDHRLSADQRLAHAPRPAAPLNPRRRQRAAAARRRPSRGTPRGPRARRPQVSLPSGQAPATHAGPHLSNSTGAASRARPSMRSARPRISHCARRQQRKREKVPQLAGVHRDDDAGGRRVGEHETGVLGGNPGRQQLAVPLAGIPHRPGERAREFRPRGDGGRNHVLEVRARGDIALALLGIGGDAMAHQLVARGAGNTFDAEAEHGVLENREMAEAEDAADESGRPGRVGPALEIVDAVRRVAQAGRQGDGDLGIGGLAQQGDAHATVHWVIRRREDPDGTRPWPLPSARTSCGSDRRGRRRR